MAVAKGIPGRLASRVVGVIELVLAFVLVGIFVWFLNSKWNDFQHSSRCVLEAIIFGVYVLADITISVLLIGSTFPSIKLHNRKWMAVLWCTFDMISFIGSVVLMCVHEAFEANAELFLGMVLALLKWATFFCVVCTYVTELSEQIQVNKSNRMPASPIRMGTRRPAGGMWLLQGKREVGKLKISTKL